MVTGSASPGGVAALWQEVGDRGPLLLLHKPIEHPALSEALRHITAPALGRAAALAPLSIG